MLGLSEEQRAKLVASTHDTLESAFAGSQREAMALLGESTSPDQKLTAGVERYRRLTRPSYAHLFEQLAEGQAPHTLFITCSDSRVVPNLITGTDPGELFIVRNLGGLVAREGAGYGSSVGAAVDYAVGVLGVRKIVVCGHSGCGAIKALLGATDQAQPFSSLDAWLRVNDVRRLFESFTPSLAADDVARLVVRAQIERLLSYRVVAEATSAGRLSLAAWFFDVRSGELEEWSPAGRRFVGVGAGAGDDARSVVPALRPRPA